MNIQLLRDVANFLHGVINVSAGNIREQIAFEILSRKFPESQVRYAVPVKIDLLRRENHKVDVVVEDSNRILLINCKSKGISNTEPLDGQIRIYTRAREQVAMENPDKEVQYIILRFQSRAYDYTNQNQQFSDADIQTFDMDEYLGIDMGTAERAKIERLLQQRLQEKRAEGKITEEAAQIVLELLRRVK